MAICNNVVPEGTVFEETGVPSGEPAGEPPATCNSYCISLVKDKNFSFFLHIIYQLLFASLKLTLMIEATKRITGEQGSADLCEMYSYRCSG